jgi:hypothetical protein
MLALGRPVLTFLNYLSEERGITGPDDPGPLQRAVAETEISPFDEIEYAESFEHPDPELVPQPPQTSTVSYARRIAQIDELKELFRVTSNREVGEKTFDYYYDQAFGDIDQ